MMSLTTPEKVGKLQAALHDKAKQSPTYRFYLLYDKVHRADVLAFADVCCRHNDGAPGVDGQTFDDIEEYGRDRWLDELAEELRRKTYQPQAVRRVCPVAGKAAKPDGKQRPLGIPTIRDRRRGRLVSARQFSMDRRCASPSPRRTDRPCRVQMAAVLVLEPIFETDLQPEQSAYRKERSALDAVTTVNEWLHRGYTEVVDADLSGYFDTIPHAELMKSVARRVSDRHLLHLIKMWLEAPVEETDEQGRIERTTRNKDEGRGTPQGRRGGGCGTATNCRTAFCHRLPAAHSPAVPVASPLLANLYRRRFVLGCLCCLEKTALGHAQRLDAHIVNYADDFVIGMRPGRADEAMAAMRTIMGKIRLTVNETKTRICRLPEEPFDFLGDTFGRQYSRRTGGADLGLKPSKKKIGRLCEAISTATDRRTTGQDVREVVKDLNAKLRGWSNYFRVGTVLSGNQRQGVHADEIVMKHTRHRLRQWLGVKHKVRGSDYARFPNAYLHEELGLHLLPGSTTGWKRANP